MLNQAASTHCSGDNKEKLSANIRSEYASDFCHYRKSTLKLPMFLSFKRAKDHGKNYIKSQTSSGLPSFASSSIENCFC